MAADAILNYAKAYKVPVRDSLDLDSRHIKLTFHKFSAIYIFFPFDNLKKSNDLGLIFMPPHQRQLLSPLYLSDLIIPVI